MSVRAATAGVSAAGRAGLALAGALALAAAGRAEPEPAGAPGPPARPAFGAPVGVEPPPGERLPPPVPRPVLRLAAHVEPPGLDLTAQEEPARPSLLPRPTWRLRLPGLPGEEGAEMLLYAIPLRPPGPRRLFELESEAALREQLRQEARSRGRAIDFPAEAGKETEPGPARAGPTALVVPPLYVCHKRLFFEQPAVERTGRNVGPLQPLVSAGTFYADVLTFPLRWLAAPLQVRECHSDGRSPFFCPEFFPR